MANSQNAYLLLLKQGCAPVERARGLEGAPGGLQRARGQLQVQQVPEQELVLGQCALADYKAHRPLHLNAATPASAWGLALTHASWVYVRHAGVARGALRCKTTAASLSSALVSCAAGARARLVVQHEDLAADALTLPIHARQLPGVPQGSQTSRCSKSEPMHHDRAALTITVLPSP